MKVPSFKTICWSSFGVVAVAVAFALGGPLWSDAGTVAEAAVDNRPVGVQETEISMRRNQASIDELNPQIEATKKALDELEKKKGKFKEDNAVLFGRLSVWGFTFDWITLTAIKSAESSPL